MVFQKYNTPSRSLLQGLTVYRKRNQYAGEEIFQSGNGKYLFTAATKRTQQHTFYRRWYLLISTEEINTTIPVTILNPP